MQVGSVLPIEEIAQKVPAYPDGRRPVPRTVARRLLEYGAIELVERGPNGAKGRGAKYKVLSRPSIAHPIESIVENSDYLREAVERMTGEKGKR
jgi:hypothetical protein